MIASTNAQETESLGQQIGKLLRGGEVIELKSDLGGGKTTLARGIVAGSGSTARVASPTFTVSKEYPVPAVPGRELERIIHADFYRLQDAGIMNHELLDAMNDTATTVLVEWGDIVADILPAARMTISIEVTGDSSRRIIIDCAETMQYLIDWVEP